jgi:hypothetical protein
MKTLSLTAMLLLAASGLSAAERSGRQALSLGWDDTAVIGYSYWFADRFAIKAALGGYGQEQKDGTTYSNYGTFKEKLGLRYSLWDFDAGVLFGDLYGAASQNNQYYYEKIYNPFYVSHNTSHYSQSSWIAGLGLGGEIFWPGSRRASLEVGTALEAEWENREQISHVDSQPSGYVGTGIQQSDSYRFSLGSVFRSITAAVNLYF